MGVGVDELHVVALACFSVPVVLMLWWRMLSTVRTVTRQTQRGVVLTDACPATQNPDACSRVFYGVMRKGLFSAIQSFSNLVGSCGGLVAV